MTKRRYESKVLYNETVSKHLDYTLCRWPWDNSATINPKSHQKRKALPRVSFQWGNSSQSYVQSTSLILSPLSYQASIALIKQRIISFKAEELVLIAVPIRRLAVRWLLWWWAPLRPALCVRRCTIRRFFHRIWRTITLLIVRGWRTALIMTVRWLWSQITTMRHVTGASRALRSILISKVGRKGWPVWRSGLGR
jgi:hypothetical protein